MWEWLAAHPDVMVVVRNMLSGIAAAAVVDFSAFRAWKSVKEAYAYDWPIAFWRWFQGGVTGAVTGTIFGNFN